ncbi:MAG: carbohydrate kinase [Oscillospiraceae bacterium]|jgi:fructokinase|nr:carbohydrate kinase [Oscillospiraceae bacterium]
MDTAEVVCFGEVLVDFTPAGLSGAGMRLFEQNAGGAPANVAAALAKLGRRAAFAGKVGRDMHGDFLRRALLQCGVDVANLAADPREPTSMAFVALSDEGERGFSFMRGADAKLPALSARALRGVKVFHFGSLSMTSIAARAATQKTVRLARKAGCVISFDPNYRAMLWPSERAAALCISSALGQTDILKVSEEEALLLTGIGDAEGAGKALLSRGPCCVCVTLGARGALLCRPGFCLHTPTYPGPVTDTTGAGDAFTAGFLRGLLARGLRPQNITEPLARELCAFAHAAATLCVAKRGGIPAMPGLEDVTALMRKENYP